MRKVTCCRGLFLALVLLLGFLPAVSYGADVRLESDTIFRVFQRDTAEEEDAAVLPIYEYLQVDVGELEDFGLSFHAYGWGRADLADSEYYGDEATGEVLYGYLEYTRPANRFALRLGRQYVFEGVANEAIDGVRLSGDLGDYFSLSAYGGQPVGLESVQGRTGDSIFGGRLAHRRGGSYEVGISYKAVENDNETAEDMLGVDLAVYLPGDLSLYGNSSYNQETEDWGEHSYDLRVPFGKFVLKPFYQHFSYEDYFAVGANAVNPFRILAQSKEELTAYGIDALWQYNDNWILGGKVQQHDYDQVDSAQVVTVSVAWKGDNLTQYGAEVGRAVAEDVAGNDYTLVRLYGYCEEMAGKLGIDFFSADLLLASYDQEIYGEDSSLFVSVGAGKRYRDDSLSVKLSGDYSQDPYFEEDLRAALTVSYNFAK